MICRPCLIGEYLLEEKGNVTGLARSWHRECKKGDCVCEHIVSHAAGGRTWKTRGVMNVIRSGVRLHPEVPHPAMLRADLQAARGRVAKANDWLAGHLAVVFGAVWTVWVFFLWPLAAEHLGAQVQSQTSYYAQSWIQLFALPLFVYVGNKLQRSSDAQSDAFHQALTHIANVEDQNNTLIQQNTELTQAVHDLLRENTELTQAVHDSLGKRLRTVMSVLLFADSAWPLPASQIPAGVSGVCGYIGGDTPHVWTPAEWGAQKTRFRLPIYVRSNPPGPGAGVDVAAAVAQLRILGAPPGCLVAWDMETAVDPEYIGQVYEGLTAAGFKLIVYGSRDFVAGNKNPDGYYWGADWTNIPHITAGNTMTQFVSFANYDESQASSSLPFWDTAPVAAEPVSAPVELTLSVRVPQLEAGADDRGLPHWFVRRLQAVLNAVYGAGLVVDGQYGPLSQDAVRVVQRRYSLPVSGVADQATWERILGG